MAKGYMISAHRRAADPEKASAYRDLAVPALISMGGKFLSAGGRVVAKESGLAERTILIEFESFEAAVNAYESEAYQRALKLLGDLLGRGGRVPPDTSEVAAGGGTGGSHECKVLVEHAKRSRVLSRAMNAV